ncbi:MAG: DUF2252 domain-containing protein [Comamonadaceae bacterium]|nr:DUF2252 domain-containing protein [Comamonadaceae bacterium]
MTDPEQNPTEQWIEQGRALRKTVKRSDHLALGHLHRDPVALLQATDKGRVERLVPLRYGRMLTSPFAFFRGSAILQAHDLKHTPNTGLLHPICGDAHLMNFGGYGTPERQLAFDLNDFDETHPGPWEWDLKRLVASLNVAARHLGFTAAQGDEAVASAVTSYQQHTAGFSQMDALSQWQTLITLDSVHGASEDTASREQLAKAMSKAQRRSHETLLPRMGAKVDGRWTLHDAPPALFHIHGDSTLFSPEDDWMRLGHWTELTDHLYSGYLAHVKPDVRALLGRFRMQDLVFKVVGVGSVGTRCLVLLLTDATDAPMMLQIKQANASVLAHYVPGKSPHIKHQGERVVAGQRLMQATSDRFLGATTGPSGRHFYVRQLRDMKVSAEVETFNANLLTRYGALCGQVLARAHAKSGGYTVQVSAYLGKGGAFTEALVAYAKGYANQVERDYSAFREACRAGRVTAQTEADFAADFSP